MVPVRESPDQGGGLKGRAKRLDQKYGIFKIAKFAIASGTGFLIAEGIITLGVLSLYHRLTPPGSAYSSPAFLAIDVSALALGVAASFFLNEHFTVGASSRPEGSGSLPIRLLKFEGVNAMGNLTIIVVQFALLLTFSLSPVIGNIVGAIVSYPITYVISMHFVWGSGSSRLDEKVPSARKRRPSDTSSSPRLPLLAIASLGALYLASFGIDKKLGAEDRDRPAQDE
jgi:putative flippase GtrA